MPSFDISSEFDKHELSNAINQANREVSTRFDFKDSQANFTLEGETLKLLADNEFQLQQMKDILRQKLAKRGVDTAHLKEETPTLQYKKAEQVIALQEGISQEIAKKIIKFLKDHKLPVQASITGNKIRVTGKKKDDLQKVIALLKANDFTIPLQFGNYRD